MGLYQKDGTLSPSILDSSPMLFMLEAFKKMTPEDLLAYIRNPFMKTIAPKFKESGVLYQKYLYDTNMLDDTRLMVLLANLYLELFVEEIAADRLRNPKTVADFRYLQKLRVLNAVGIIEGDLYTDMNLVNLLRNNYAHDLSYEVGLETIKKISCLKNYAVPQPFTKSEEKKEYYHYLVSLFLYQLIHELISKFKVLELKRLPPKLPIK